MKYPRHLKYKDSGIEWLGEVPEGWEIKRLKWVCDAFPSNVDKKSYDDGQPVSLCNYTDVYYNESITPALNFMAATATTEQVIKFSLKSGDTIITKDSETADDIAIAAYVPEDMPGVVCGYHLSIVRPKGKVCGAFIKNIFDSSYAKNKFAVLANGLTRVGLGQYALDNVEFPFPPLEEQQAIAAFLDTETARMDALIAEYETLIDLLKEKRQALISQAVTKGLNPDVPMKDSGVEWLGEVPEHWRLYQTKRLFRLVVEQAPDDNNEELLSIYTSIGVRPRKSLEEKGNKATTTNGYWIVRKGDIIVNKLLAWMGAIGLSEYDGVTSPAYDIFRRIKPLVPKYYSELFRCGIMFSEFRRHSRGIMDMRLRLYFEDFGQLVIPYPPPSEQMEIVKALELELGKMDELVANAEIGINLLKERRTTLISDAVTGKIDVRTSSVVDTSDIA